ncbi:MAG: efflux RND transporter periplasmic adaptor subunit, partial [Proteobacteria bacterium]|nr:efflux RND transporter periplasmic adaptor subunit [Pseudomonadota bacterium]
MHDTQRTKSPSKRALLDRIRDLVAAGVGLAKRKPFLSAGIAAVLIVVVGYNSLSGSEAGRNLILVTAQRGDVENVVTAVGNLQPLNYVDVGAQVSGQLKVLYVAAGDEVTQGDLLAEIDSTIAEAEVEADLAQLRNLNAQLAERQSSLELAAVQASRQERLLAEDATSQDAFDSAQASLRGAQAQVRAVRAQISQSESTLKAAEAELGYSRIFAPLSGTVSSITARQGQTLNANNQTPTILQIADLRVMTVSAQVSEADVQKLYVGMETYFTTLGARDQRWGGRLRQILPTPTVTNNVVLYTALFDVANPDKQLMTQMTAQVFFVLEAAHDVVTAPAAAIRYAPRTADRSGRRLGAP